MRPNILAALVGDGDDDGVIPAKRVPRKAGVGTVKNIDHSQVSQANSQKKLSLVLYFLIASILTGNALTVWALFNK